MSVIHLSGAEVARDFATCLARVRAGDEIVIDDGQSPCVNLSVAAEPASRTIAESLKLARAHAKERGYDVVMDAHFAADVVERIRAPKPRDTSAWD